MDQEADEMETDTFEKFEASMKEFGRTQYDGLADDDDPLAHAMIVSKDDGITMVGITLDMMAPGNKQTLILGICQQIAEAEAVRLGWLLPAYKIIPTEGDTRPPAANFADDDRAIEVFRCIVIDAERTAGYEALVKRNPSRLEPWVPRGTAGGLFVDLPQRALKAVATQ
jgi:hypothetical protein